MAEGLDGSVGLFRLGVRWPSFGSLSVVFLLGVPGLRGVLSWAGRDFRVSIRFFRAFV